MEVESAQRRLIHHAAESPYQSTLLLTMGSHNCDRPSGSDGPPAYPPASPEASPHKVKVYSMPPLAAQHSAMMPGDQPMEVAARIRKEPVQRQQHRPR